MKTIDFSYFIERYIAGEMNDAEKQWFLKEMDENPKLRIEVDIRRKTDSVLKRQDIISLRNKLSSIERSRGTVTPARKLKLNLVRFAALFAILVTIAGAFLLSKNRMDDEEILGEFYTAYETTSSLRSGQMTSDPDFNLALEYYEVHDYRNAAIHFMRAIENRPDDMQSVLLNGISNFEISNYPEAERSFTTVIEDNRNLYIDHARWYLALCHIKTGERQKAVDQLTIIRNSASFYRDNAKKVLKNIK